MECELLTLETSHGTVHGMSVGSGDRLVIHFHGTWGNFYENPFIALLAENYKAHGIRFASVNLPSHDSGSINEEIDDSIAAMKSWIDVLSAGSTSIILQGHSLGALKIIALLRTADPEFRRKIAGVILLSPFDIVRFYGGADEARTKKRAIAEELVANQGPDSLITPDIFALWPIASGLFLRVTEPGSEWDLFPSRELNNCRQLLTEIQLPTLIALGNDDFASNPIPSQIADALNGIDQLSIELIDNAPHNFAGQEQILRERINKFLTKLS